MSELGTLDIAVLLVYVLGVVAFGCWFTRRTRTADEFMAAGRSLPGWVVGLSVFGTYLSSITFLGVPGNAYGSNWNFFIFSLALPIAVLIAVRWFVPFFRQGGEISAYHHLEHRFGAWARTYAVICYLLPQIGRVGTILFGVALALKALLGWELPTTIVVTGVLVTLYTLLGGIAAVIWTDVVQAIVLTVGAVIAAAILLWDVPGGPARLLEIASENDKFSPGSFGADLGESTVWVVLVYGIFINLNNFGVDQNFVQRYHTARSGREAAKSLWLGALMYIPVAALFFFIGTALFAYYEEQPELLYDVKRSVAEQRLAGDEVRPGSPEYSARLDATVAALGPGDIGDRVFPHFMVNRLPRGLAGLLIAALLAAAMSTVDSSLNSSVTVFTSDIYRRYFRPDLDDASSFRVLRVGTVIFGALGTGAALAMIRVQGMLEAWWNIQGIFAGALLGLFLLGLMSRRARSPAALTGVIVGVAAITWLTLATMKDLPEWLPRPYSPFHKHLTIVVGTLTIFLVGLLVGFLVGFLRPGSGTAGVLNSRRRPGA